MYNSFEIIDSWRKARDYKEGYDRLGFDDMAETEWQVLDTGRWKCPRGRFEH